MLCMNARESTMDEAFRNKQAWIPDEFLGRCVHAPSTLTCVTVRTAPVHHDIVDRQRHAQLLPAGAVPWHMALLMAAL